MKWKSDETAFLNQVGRLKTSGTDWGWGERTGRKKESLLIMCYLLIPSLKPPSYTLTPTTNASVPNLSKWHGFF